MRKRIFIILALILILSESCIGQKGKETIVRFETTYGDITVKLYSETIKHHDNFVKLVNKGFYNGVLFHRVISGFMIQAGDPGSKTVKAAASLGSGDVGYTIPAEFIYPKYYHKRGALSAAREGDNNNPLKASSGCQFYIVEGKLFSDNGLDSIEINNKQKMEDNLFQAIVKSKQVEINKYNAERNQSRLVALRDSIMEVVKVQIEKNTSYKFTAQQRSDYKTIGGTPHLDGAYTVFGEVTEGLDIVTKISNAKTGPHDRPLIDIRVIKAKVLN
jgi:cyclophilin family peptidyl-prolyl cis-trans isomerase